MVASRGTARRRLAAAGSWLLTVSCGGAAPEHASTQSTSDAGTGAAASESETRPGAETEPGSTSTSTTTASTGEPGTTTGDTDVEPNVGPPEVVRVLPIADVWSGHPVPFALVTHDPAPEPPDAEQFAGFYDADRRMTIASRSLADDTWQLTVLPTSVGWDSHNAIAMALDDDGHLHVAGNMHNVPLVYFRTTRSLDASSLERVPAMIGTNEQSCTYPEFFRGPDGALVFMYRDGGSGNGNHIFNAYDTASRTWSRLLETPLTNGEGARNAYPVGPIQGPDGSWHLVWVWRDTPDAATNHDLSYARTRNLVDWESGAGARLTLPITLAGSDIVDPVPVMGGMINNNTKVGFDAEARPIVAYHKYDAEGNTQLYNARLEDGAWVVYQTSSWDYRWAFGGNGTLVFEIEVAGVETQPDGTLTQTFYHARYGGWGAFRLDPGTLAAVEEIDPPLPYPPELDAVRSPTPGMLVRWQSDARTADPASHYFMLRWETLASNRDMPRDVIPPPTPLELYELRRGPAE